MNIVAGQDRVVNVDGYKWFGKPRIDQNNLRGERWVGFLVRECIVEEVEYVWMKVRGGRGKEVPVIKKFKKLPYLDST